MKNPADAIPVITIDGPVGSGKGTIAARLAERLGWHLLDSGALYRLVALSAMDGGVAAEDEAALERLAAELDAVFRFEQGALRIFLQGREVTGAIREEAVSTLASRVASVGAVRDALEKRQRAFRQAPGLVADGRDMGTVIFPDAKLKIFLTANVQARAERRYKQLKEKGESVNLSRLFGDLEARDRRDTQRDVAPLKPAPDAVTIDSTAMSIEEVVHAVVKLAEERYPSS
ncbi:(d)CMP kinase [Marinihelvus fidelis]|uniref:Cytidylate kinase n=1 Tax=Marinihelvus fidelis TaxID=2613842 RepID=A0A5N0TFL9_9GAMM|nr:(d)CMP kinase [Marinihelvus fidelis]KAA9132059.1 (d)CMP kinase [Marinihelvus fidelis]